MEARTFYHFPPGIHIFTVELVDTYKIRPSVQLQSDCTQEKSREWKENAKHG